MDDTCVLVSSSDRTKDIFDVVFRNSERTWDGCKWPRYVGFTTQQSGDLFGFMPLASHGKSSWREELSDQIACLPANINFVPPVRLIATLDA